MTKLYNELVKMTAEQMSKVKGVDEEEALLLAKNAAVAFCKKHGGEYFRVPRVETMRRRERRKAIAADRAVMSVKDICAKHKISRASVYRC